jgi:hypothetical protein
MIVAFADKATGQNQAQQGQFVKGNKTQHEYQDVMGHSNGRNQTIALTIENQVMIPLKEIIKLNILQYQGTAELYNQEKNQMVKVDPMTLRKTAMQFKMSDGMMPKDKLMSAEAFQGSLQVIGSSPQISQGYNIAPMFSYIMKQQGADLKAFEKSPEQMQYEQALSAWQNSAAMLAQKADMTPEQVQQALGPMPQPPQSPQQASQAAVAQANSPTASLQQVAAGATAPAQ